MSYYDGHMPTCKVSVLGTEYSIYLDVPEAEDATLETCDGYCDKTSHKIVVCERAPDSNLDDYSEYRKRLIRHEIIHAFLFESGLAGDSVWYVQGQEHPEQTVDWMAYQFPKILKAFQTVDAI